MSFATQGAIAGSVANSNSMIRGSIGGNRQQPVSPSSFNIENYKKNLREQIGKAKEEDLRNLKQQYLNALDKFTTEEGKEELHDDIYDNFRNNLMKTNEDSKKSLHDYIGGNPNKGKFSVKDWQIDMLMRQYEKAGLNKQIDKYVDQYAEASEKAKSFLDEKATDTDIEMGDILNFQNQYIDEMNKLENMYDEVYSNQLKTIENGIGHSMYGKRVTPIKIRRFHPKLRAKIRIRPIKIRIVLPKQNKKSQNESLKRQFDRNFRRII